MKPLVLAVALLSIGAPVAAGSDGSGSRYFDPNKIATWSTCAKEDPAPAPKGSACVPESSSDRLRGYSVQADG